MAGILILSVDRMLAQRISEAMGDRISVALVQAIEPDMLDGPGVVVIDRSAIPPERSLAVAIGAVAQSAGGRPLILASDETDGGQILSAVRAGAHDVIRRDAEGAEVAEVMARLLNNALVEQGRDGHLTLLLGPDVEAVTLLATDMALTRAAGRPSSLLIDCTLPTSAAEAYLDLQVNYGVASGIADIDRLDSNLLASALARHEPSGLQLLTLDGGAGAEPVGIAPNDIAALVRLLRLCSGDVVMSAGSLRHGGLLRDLCALADRVELVCTQSIRDLEAMRRLLDKIGPDARMMARMRLLMWDHQPGVLLDGRRMSEALGVSASVAVPVDMVRLRNGLNAGRPLALEADGGAYLQAVRRICGVATPPPGGLRGQVDTLRRALLRTLERGA
ncbi:MAG TPA: histidine kinase [Sphingobium sp.]|nr:histidine kinase [Sphingobium sp.]